MLDRDGEETEPETMKRLRAALRWGKRDSDEIESTLDDAVTRIEQSVRPVLEFVPKDRA